MFKRNDAVRYGVSEIRAGIKRSGWATLAAAVLVAGPAADAKESVAPTEGSLLIATREAEASHQTGQLPAVAADGSALEPISQVAERSPELANLTSAESDGTSQFSQALAAAANTNQTPSGSAESQVGSAAQTVAAEPAKFNGVQPGTSTKADVLTAWGQPAETNSTGEGAVLTYAIEPFQAVEVLISGDTVSAIKIELRRGLPAKRLAKQLTLENIEPVEVSDETGQLLGQAYPERGVLFMFATPDTSGGNLAATTAPQVTHVVIQPLDANAFALRAENHLHGPYDKNIRDLQTALGLNPNLAHAHWLLAEIYLSVGRPDQADAEATDACDLEADNAAYQLRRARSLKALGRCDDATYKVREVLDQETAPPIVKAQALHEMALLAAMGDASIAQKSISFDTKAIELADTLATSRNVKERRAAKQLLVEAHLAVAREIASHAFNDKLASVSQWIGRASGLAEDYIAQDGGSLELRLQVAKESLASLASFKPTKDPGPFVAEAQSSADALVQQCDDDLWRRKIQWELGQAYYHAVRVEHSRLQSASALRYGQLAIENLADGAEKRQAVHESEQLVGELYFQIGAIHAVHKQDHKTACQWYDKAVPLLTAPHPASDLLAPRRDGEELVSMGVSYWQTGDKDRAIDLTLNGTELVQKAVDQGVLPKSSLAVPYGNLASMYQQLGETADAAKYTELAKQATAASAPIGPIPAEKPRSAVNPQRSRPINTSQRRPTSSTKFVRNGSRQPSTQQTARHTPQQRSTQQRNSQQRTAQRPNSVQMR